MEEDYSLIPIDMAIQFFGEKTLFLQLGKVDFMMKIFH
jgi:hypothetical protein